MKFVILIITPLFVLSCASLGDSHSGIRGPFEVIGEGFSEAQAREDGFRQAVGMAMGIAIRSERQIKNNETAVNYILTHSSGYVDSFSVKNKKKNQQKIILTMEVYIKPTMLDDYAIKSTDTNLSVNGEDLKEGINTYLDEKKRGDDLLKSVLEDFPSKSFYMTVSPVNFRVTSEGYVVASFNYEIKWSDSFLRSLSQTISQVKDIHCSFACDTRLPFLELNFKNVESDWFHKTYVHYFKDRNKINLITSKLSANYFLKIDFYDKQSDLIFTSCYDPERFRDGLSRSKLKYIYSSKISDVSGFNIFLKKNSYETSLYRRIEDVSNVKVSITRPELCKPSR